MRGSCPRCDGGGGGVVCSRAVATCVGQGGEGRGSKGRGAKCRDGVTTFISAVQEVCVKRKQMDVVCSPSTKGHPAAQSRGVLFSRRYMCNQSINSRRWRVEGVSKCNDMAKGASRD